MNIKIAGIQKLTLLDYPEKVACTIFLQGCNLRCPFCHNSEIIDVRNKNYNQDYNKIIEFLSSRKGMLDGVCISGGEPTIYKDLPFFLKEIKELGYMVKLDTNGYNPSMLKELIEKKLVDYIAMDIKNSPDKYGVTVGVDNLDISKLEESILYLLESNIEYEFRTTVVAEFHNEEAIKDMGKWLFELANGKKINKLYLQPFIDRESVLQQGLHSPEDKSVQKFKDILKEFVDLVKIRTEE
jgi:pyruvate formate lyase activating enzyme